jgi:signal transduction histidine kinase
MSPATPLPAPPDFDSTAEESSIPLLLVDDDPLLRQMLGNALTIGGYQVTWAEDGLDGLEQAQRGHFPVVVTDMEMPRMDGRELVAALADLDPHIECLLLAEPQDLERIIQASENGNVYNHFWKPLDNLGDLMRGIARALERRELRLAKAHLFTELRDTREELHGLCSRLEQLDKVAALGHMAAAVARDLESPMISLLGYAQYLRARLERKDSEPLTVEQVDRILEYMREMEGGIRKCHSAVAGILDYTRVHEEPPEPLNVHEILGEALALMQHSLETQGASLCLNLTPSPPPVMANPRRLQQALLSVLLNAQQAVGTSGGTVTVTTDCLADDQGRATSVRIRVADTGVGIAPGVLPHVFDAFFTTRPHNENLGLGLTIARNIVRAWRGNIRLESAPSKGTTVFLTLPVCTEMAVPLDRQGIDWFLDDEEGPGSAEKAA